MQAGREIKFRAWDEEKKRMYDGEAIEAYDYLVTGLSYGTLFVGLEYPDWRELTALQFTGLRDKNGKEIYEGDIVRRLDWEYNYLVKWNQESADFYFHDKTNDEDDHLSMLLLKEAKCEVVGNVYENPELVEVDK